MKNRLIGFFVLAVFLFSFSFIFSSCSKASDPNAQLNAELTAIDAYITANPGSYYDVLYSNITVAITSPGHGAMPVSGQKVFVYYKASLLSDGTVFQIDSLQDVLLESITTQGLQAVAALPEGSSARIFVPSQFAYGSQGDASLNIPPNATIVYDVYLKKVTMTAAQAEQFDLDEQRIQHYLDSLQIQAVKLYGGVWIHTTSAGTGANPKIYDYISFHYKGSILSNGSVFQESDLTTYPLVQLIQGLQMGIPAMTEGAASTFYIPSIYGYGTNKDGNGKIINNGIPSNAPLIFEIKLNGINQ